MLCQLVVELVLFVVASIDSLGKSKMGSTLGQTYGLEEFNKDQGTFKGANMDQQRINAGLMYRVRMAGQSYWWVCLPPAPVLSGLWLLVDFEATQHD